MIRKKNLFFVNFEGHVIRGKEDIQAVEDIVTEILSPLGKKVYAIVNYDNFDILPELVDMYTDRVKRIVKKFYTGLARYTYHQHVSSTEAGRCA